MQLTLSQPRRLMPAGIALDASRNFGTLTGMANKLLALTLTVLATFATTLHAQDESSGKLPPTAKLPMLRELPDPFKMNDGKRIKSPSDWPARRAEILKMALQYEYGRVPTTVDPVTATESSADKSADRVAHDIVLKMGPEGKVSTHLILTTPAGAGPFPVIVKGDMTWGRVEPEIISTIISRGYALAEFDRTQIAADKNDRGVGVFPLYPDYDWGVLAAWAWGYARVNDYLITRPDIDRAKLIITGHSRGGKATLLAGALDERVALTVPNGSGCGGSGLYRVEWPTSENIHAVVTHFPFWFGPHFDEFVGHVDQLPFDQHEIKALIAPRALLTTDSLDDLWANPIGTEMSFLASREVFKFLGAEEKTGLHYRHGKHDQNAEDFAALLDFADWQLLGKKSTTKFDELPFPTTPSAYSWTAPH
jgi:hypothetical protein